MLLASIASAAQMPASDWQQQFREDMGKQQLDAGFPDGGSTDSIVACPTNPPNYPTGAICAQSTDAGRRWPSTIFVDAPAALN